MITIRNANIHDAAALSLFVKLLDCSSPYILFDACERRNDIDSINAYLKSINNNHSTMIIAENRKLEVVGFICGEVSRLCRLSHAMKVNIGVLPEYRQHGVAIQLARKLIDYARTAGIIRLEMSVIKENAASLALCRFFGCRIEGVKRGSIKIDEKFHDEYMLAKHIV